MSVSVVDPTCVLYLRGLIRDNGVPRTFISRDTFEILVVGGRLKLFRGPFTNLKGDKGLALRGQRGTCRLTNRDYILLGGSGVLPLDVGGGIV